MPERIPNPYPPFDEAEERELSPFDLGHLSGNEEAELTLVTDVDESKALLSAVVHAAVDPYELSEHEAITTATSYVEHLERRKEGWSPYGPAAQLHADYFDRVLDLAKLADGATSPSHEPLIRAIDLLAISPGSVNLYREGNGGAWSVWQPITLSRLLSSEQEAQEPAKPFTDAIQEVHTHNRDNGLEPWLTRSHDFDSLDEAAGILIISSQLVVKYIPAAGDFMSRATEAGTGFFQSWMLPDLDELEGQVADMNESDEPHIVTGNEVRATGKIMLQSIALRRVLTLAGIEHTRSNPDKESRLTDNT